MVHYKLAFILPFAIIALLLIASWKVQSYVEIHYIFFGYSLINNTHPEVLVDVPWRVDASEQIPVLCIIKDSDRFPIKLKRITARYGMKDGETHEKSLLDSERPLYISEFYWDMLSFIEVPKGETGYLKVAIELSLIHI